MIQVACRMALYRRYGSNQLQGPTVARHVRNVEAMQRGNVIGNLVPRGTKREVHSVEMRCYMSSEGTLASDDVAGAHEAARHVCILSPTVRSTESTSLAGPCGTNF